jgi:hypothetical protein
MFKKSVLVLSLCGAVGLPTASAADPDGFAKAVRELKMPGSGLPFDLIDDYKSYKIVAGHYRTDKNEIRYILANDAAYEALKTGTLPMPEGSKVVKIGWTTKKMANYPDALEADEVQRIEYMYKDSKRFTADGWGYARFVKKNGSYFSWDKGVEGCVACHAAAADNDYLFTRYQPLD